MSTPHTPRSSGADRPFTGVSAARTRILDTASRLFYGEGIRAVGVDRIIAEAHVTMATFYRHFPTKDDLVCSYLRAEDRQIRTAIRTNVEATDPDRIVHTIYRDIGEYLCRPGFRGCPFINAAAEYPDPAHPVRRVIDGHRGWFQQTLAEALAAAGATDPAHQAQLLVMLRDGALVGGYLSDPQTIQNRLRTAVASLLARPTGS